MISVKKLFEENNYPNVLLALLDVCVAIAHTYPHIFKPHFEVCLVFIHYFEFIIQDIIDITVGWYIDIEQTTQVFDKCESTIKALRPFWINAIPFGIQLLRQFLDDAVGYVEV